MNSDGQRVTENPRGRRAAAKSDAGHRAGGLRLRRCPAPGAHSRAPPKERGSGPRARGRTGPGHLACDHGPALRVAAGASASATEESCSRDWTWPAPSRQWDRQSPGSRRRRGLWLRKWFLRRSTPRRAENKLARKPANLTFEQAAVVPVSASTALQALRAAGITPGQKVLILGASGGVGSYAVQLAKASGLEVTGVCSTVEDGPGARPRRRPRHRLHPRGLRRRHAEVRPDPGSRRKPNPCTPAPRTHPLRHGRHHRRGGRRPLDRRHRPAVPGTGPVPVHQPAADHARRREGSEDLEYLAGLIDAGTLTPAIDRTYPLDQVPDAMRYFDAGNARGKIAITL